MRIARKQWWLLFILLLVLSLTGCGSGEQQAQVSEHPAMSITVTGSDGVAHKVDLNQLTPVTLRGGYKKSTGTIVGPDAVTGVKFSDIVELIGGWQGIKAMDVHAADGYGMTLTADQLQGRVEAYDLKGNDLGIKQFEVLLIFDSPTAELMNVSPRLAFVGDNLSYGPLWVQQVASITAAKEPAADK